ncbi:MAG: beta-phosphoglucomutase [Prevotellaceae bacterium]|nr:beta-phosphoglucomutase [Prevotellaceae bacterium]
MIKGVIFDLDGVIVSTDELHYQGWKYMADSEGIYFDRQINERLRGVSRMESLSIILEKASKTYTDAQKEALATLKNDYYKELLATTLSPADILPGVLNVLSGLKAAGIKIAIGSSSKNTPTILKQIGLDKTFDAVSDGNNITNSKPDPEVFLIAAEWLGLKPEDCLVVEDAEAGVTAAKAGGMKALAVGSAATDDRADLAAADLSLINVEQMINL